MTKNNLNIKGLTDDEVRLSRQKHGSNRLIFRKESGFLKSVKSLSKEPMLILLLVASAIYFITGDVGDGIFLSFAVVLVSAISLFQDSRSRRALEKLKDFTSLLSTVIRDSKVISVKSDELVMGDSLIVEEGSSIAADGNIIHSNDFSVNESILTGESLTVFKDKGSADNVIYRGTTVGSGLAIAIIKAIGKETRLGKIGKSLESIRDEKTPLEKQINNFVKKMAIAGVIVFVIVWVINYLRSYHLLDSLLKALTLAMSIMPEEIPVAFTTFMALGAWRLMKMGIVVKQMKTVETLGSATVICTDKTGTITENKMTLAKLFVLSSKKFSELKDVLSEDEKNLIRLAMWASEPIPFDPMEVALHSAYAGIITADERIEYGMIHEYPLGGKPPMMTHIFESGSGKRIIAAKGAPEALMSASNLSGKQRPELESAIETLAQKGYRVLAVGEAKFSGNNFPATQQEFCFDFKGLVAFYDPPKPGIQNVLDNFYKAGIKVKIITGDNAATTAAIAKEIGFRGFEKTVTGDELLKLSGEALSEKVATTNVFTRMFPEAKLTIINTLKSQNEIVAMIGDGVNDGPALKSAHIGIAMGKKGTEIAKEAASLILVEDDLAKMVDAVAMGRKIYSNLKKAIQYIISIHIPIIFTVFIPLALGWVYPNIFSPVHIIFLELVMGPTCSIVYENEPLENNTMKQKPRMTTNSFFSWKELSTSIVQGFMIAAGALGTYRYAVGQGADEALTRTMVFTVLITANIFLTLVNRSFYYSVLTTLRYKNNLVFIMIGITIGLCVVLLFVKPLTGFFGFERMTISQLLVSISFGFASVMWYEIIKSMKRRKDIRT